MEREEIEELTTHDIKQRSVSGVVALVSRTFIVQIITFVSTLVLTIFLDPNTYGIFYLVSSVVNLLAYFSDIGLAAALIQKKERLTREDIATTFTIQQILVICLVLLLFLASPIVKSQYGISPEGIFLLYSMGISFFLSSLKTIPSILLERDIKFHKLILPQILETLAFNTVAVLAAWKGLGINAFSLAVLARGVVGLIAIYCVFPWTPVIGIYRSSLKSLLRFGIPYQANTFLAVLKDDGMTIILTRIIGTQGLGYLGWASRWAGLPLRIFMDNLTKVSFPAFARLQHDKVNLARAIELNLKYLTLASFPILIGMGFVAFPMTGIIPRYVKWIPALIPLYIQLYNSAWAGISTSLTNLLNATGRIKTTFKLMTMWTVLTWALFPITAMKFGYLGVSFSIGILATTSIITVVLARRAVSFSIIKALKTPVLSSLILFAFLLLLKSSLNSLQNIIVISALSIIVYAFACFLLEGRRLIDDSISLFKSRNA